MTSQGRLVGEIQSLFRYPIKSTSGQSLQTAKVTKSGLKHDRRWAAYTTDGGIASGKRTRRFRAVPGLMQWSSDIGDDHDVPMLESPDGSRYRADDIAASQALSIALGQQLRLLPETSVKKPRRNTSSCRDDIVASCLGLVDWPRNRRTQIPPQYPHRHRH